MIVEITFAQKTPSATVPLSSAIVVPNVGLLNWCFGSHNNCTFILRASQKKTAEVNKNETVMQCDIDAC